MASYSDKNKPSFLDKPTGAPKPPPFEPKKVITNESKPSDFQGSHPMPQVSDHEDSGLESTRLFDVQKHLKTPEGRREVAIELKISPTDPDRNKKIDKAIEEILEKGKKYGPVFSPVEKRSYIIHEPLEKYREKQHRIEEELADREVTSMERKERDRRKNLLEIFKELFGLKEK